MATKKPTEKKSTAKKTAARSTTSAEVELPKGVTKKELDTLASMADELFETRTKRYELQRQAKDLEEVEKEIRATLIRMLPKFKSRGIAGKVARVSLESKRIVRVNDWAKFYEHIRKTKDFDLLQRRVAEAAVEERWQAEQIVPGVVPDSITKVGVHKL